MFNRIITVLIAGAGAALLAVAQPASALVISTFTSLAAWQGAAGGNQQLEDFNGLSTDTDPNGHFGFASRDLGAFTATRTSAVFIFMAVRPGSDPTSVNGSNFLKLHTDDAANSMIWTFDFGIRALAFEWSNTDTSDVLRLVVDGQTFSVGGLGSGFFGFVADGPFTSVALGDSVGGGGTLSDVGFDNVRFATPSEVPEPASLALLGLSVAGLGWSRLRK